ncbi:hypothetical protein [Sphingomonas xinjiangensis]|uniref:5-bromo-4-chloroindolyl phosphate hydrolysis protein n=1 Tax=Sphingomonas xinjiangensis TaxID=643568 RepID=A0A840YR54_9SPHN|nr:hypothetical protein [Sphingomonas xinjiangensis]MBB5711742.1 hypothetical protein [Sphingomonas xinjiangensis]
MPTDVDRQLAQADALLARTRDRYASVSKRSRQRREAEILRRVGRIALADGLIIAVALVLGFVLPAGIGMFGALLMMALLIAATVTLAIFPGSAPPRVEQLTQVPLKALPLTTERWLEAQRPALPAPVRGLVDSIGVKLEMLAPQLALLDEHAPAAGEVRKLVGEQLPELLKGYQRVPEPLRGVERNGLTPDQQLAQGLQVIDDEIGEMSAQLAQGDLDLLATRGRYLQIKYRDDGLPG